MCTKPKPQLEELAIEIEAPAIPALRSLLARLPRLRRLTLGGKHSEELSHEQWARLLAPSGEGKGKGDVGAVRGFMYV